MSTAPRSPLVSVVIPVRNGMPYLPEAIASALAELTDDGELIVRDNCSSDGTAEWLATVGDPRVTVVSSERDMTAGENWSAVCAASRGRWVKVLCADDFLLPGALQLQLEVAESTSGAVLVASRRQVVGPDGAVMIASHGLRGLVGDFDGGDAIARSVATGTNQFGEPASVLMRGDLLRQSLPFTTQFPYLTDLDMYARVLVHGRFVGLAEVHAGFRVSAASWSSEVGSRQLAEFQGWVREHQADGSLRLSPVRRARAAIAIPAVFVARRAVSALMSRRRTRAQSR